jgi:hypothetical protein
MKNNSNLNSNLDKMKNNSNLNVNKMKKVVALFVFSSLLLCTCKDEEKTDEYIPTINLLTPNENAAFNLDEVSEISFSWAVEGITAFKLLLSLTEDLASPQVSMAGNMDGDYTKNLTADELDVQLTALGVNKGEEATVYWSVQPAGSLINAETQVRSIRITRKAEPLPPPPPPPTIALASPADNAQLNANTITYPFEFVWAPEPEVSEYTLKVSPNADFSAPVESLYEGTGYTHSLDEDALDLLLARFSVVHDGQITLHWTVTPKDDNPDVETQTRTFSIVRKAAPDMLALVSPLANGLLCVNEISASAPYEFQWTALASETQGYTLKFSADGDFTTAGHFVAYDAGNTGLYALSRLEAEGMFLDLGVTSSAQIQWTVEPKSNTGLDVEKRALTFYKWGISYENISQAAIDTHANLIDGDQSTLMIISGNYTGGFGNYVKVDLLYPRDISQIEVPLHGAGGYAVLALDEDGGDAGGAAWGECWGGTATATVVPTKQVRYIQIIAHGVYFEPTDGRGFYEVVVTFND